MDDQGTLAAIVDRLATEFPARPRLEVERIAAEAWSLFVASRDDVVLRVIVTEWYARTQLSAPDPEQRAS
ncbi:MAG TPA: hypothetical protein VFJ98_08340 [Mycobacteriales bacterium]|nr:hypothetical protein [Mycobacteriales bacterium]